MFNLPDFNEIYDSYINGHKFYTYDKLIKKYPNVENDAYMFADEDDYSNFVIDKEYVSENLWFTTKDVLKTIKINNMEKNEVLYIVKVEPCKDAYFNRSPEHIIKTNKIIIREIKQVKVVKKFIVLH